jgi:hypothetical protein
MTDTGIFIRARVGDRWESVDIGDPRLPLATVLGWLDTLDRDALLRLAATLITASRVSGASAAALARRKPDPPA